MVSVSAVVVGTPKKDERIYFIPSGGKIIGEGANVVWDLSDTLPGKYSITAGIGSDDIVSGKTATTTLVVSACPECDPPCECAGLSVWGPAAPIKRGDSFIVRARVGGDVKALSFTWKIEGGVIIGGQGTRQILVKFPDKTDVIKVTVRIGGTDPTCNCPTEASESFSVVKP